MTGQDPLVAPAGDDAALPLPDAILVDPLSDAALAAMLGDPYEAGLRSALDDGVATALPSVARELAYLDRAVAATQGRLAGLAAAPAGAQVVVGPAGVAVAGSAVANTGFGAAGAAPAPVMAWGEGSAVAVAAAGLTRVERGAMERAAAPVVPATAPLVVPAARDGGAAGVAPGSGRPGFGRMEWGGVDWGRLAGVPGVAPMPAPPAAPPAVMAPLGASLGSAGVVADMMAAPGVSAAAGAAWPSWSAAPAGDQAMPSAAPLGQGVAWSGGAADGSGAGQGAAAALPEQGARDGAQDAPGDDGAGGEGAGFGGVLKVDGALLGRFIAEQLGREAGRPPAGMTGFDPLVSPAWMSAYQG